MPASQCVEPGLYQHPPATTADGWLSLVWSLDKVYIWPSTSSTRPQHTAPQHLQAVPGWTRGPAYHRPSGEGQGSVQGKEHCCYVVRQASSLHSEACAWYSLHPGHGEPSPDVAGQGAHPTVEERGEGSLPHLAGGMGEEGVQTGDKVGQRWR